MPDIATPAVSAAPAAPAVSSPSPAPVSAPSTPAPAAPSTTETAPVIAPPSVDSAPATPSSKPPVPKQEDFPRDIEGFLNARNAWEREHGDIPEEILTETGPVDAPAETIPVEGETQPADGETADEEKPWAPEPDKDFTPEAVNELIKAKPERQAMLDADPELKNALFSMARVNSKAKGLLEIFPNTEAGQFASETSNKFVSVRGGFLDSIDNPEGIGTAFDALAQEFIERKADGTPELDPAGNPVYGQDFHMLCDHVVDSYLDLELGDLEEQIQRGQFANEGQREYADQVLQAIQFLKEFRKGENKPAAFDASALPEPARQELARREADLAEREAKLNGNEKTQTAEQRKAERDAYETNVSKKIGGAVGQRLKTMLEDKAKDGIFVPSYVTSARDPETGISLFAKNLLDKFQEATYGRVDKKTGKVIGGVAHIRNQAEQMKRLPVSAQNEQARVDFHMRVIDDFFPGIFDKELRSLQQQDIADRQKRGGHAKTREQMAEREVRGGTAPTPQSLTPEQAMKQAYEWVDKTYPDATAAERFEKALTRKNQLTGQSY